jgi:anti-anti-sigma factor
MLAATPFSASPLPLTRPAVVVELIGDADATAAHAFAEAARRLVCSEGERIVLNLQRVALIDAGGVTMLVRAINELRRRGIAVDVIAATKRVRTALSAARIFPRVAIAGDGDARERHVMIVRNADPTRDVA